MKLREAIASTVRGYDGVGWLIYVAATLVALVLPLVDFAAYLLVVISSCRAVPIPTIR